MNIGKLSPSIISEVALRCFDPKFEDFRPLFYEQAFVNASRTIARKYSILERILEITDTVTVAEGSTLDEEVLKPFTLDMTKLVGYNDPYKVVINQRLYTRTFEDELVQDSFNYTLKDTDKGLELNFSPRLSENIIWIYYTAVPEAQEFSDDTLIPFIPQKYREELKDLMTTEIAKQGIVKFDAKTQEKYKNVLNLYGVNPKEIDPMTAPSKPWIGIRIFNPLED
jgi:hypothetical protein